MKIGLREGVGHGEPQFAGQSAHPVDVATESAFEAAKADVRGHLEDAAAAGGDGSTERDHLVGTRERSRNRLAVLGQVELCAR